ncbi:MAG TPA: replicative DNA helicase [Candidatus Methylacidiphilales bacterium]|nr:replicative DNA helicase [Candidatus Methylacidiphilales bacterium]
MPASDSPAVKTPPKRGRANPAAADVLSPTVLYSAEAEKAVLGCMMAQPNEVINDATVTLSKEDFFVPAHQEIFGALRDMYNSGLAIDTIAIHQWLTDRKLAEAVGSPGILAELLVGFANHLNVGSYIRIVKEKSLLRCLQLACSTIVQDIAEMPDSVASVLDRAESAIFHVTNLGLTNSTVPAREEIDKAIALIERFQNRRGQLQGLPTGFHRLDELTAGWKPGEMIVLAARPGQGKTALALTFARRALEERYDEASDAWKKPGHAVGMFSLEMTNEQLMLRLLASFGSESLGRIRSGDLDDQAMQKLRMVAADMREWPLYLDDSSFLSINQLRGKARRMKDRHNIEMLVIDYLQLLRSESQQAKDNRQNEVAEISRGIKALAKELGIPIIILAQLNRRSEEASKGRQEPALHNLRESGAIEQDADVVLMLHRPDPEKDEDGNERQHGPIIPYNLIIAKQRNGPTDKLDILFHAPYTRFDDPVRHETRSRT